MTDITELAQSLKNAASKALIEEGLTWFSEEQLSHEDGIALHKADAEFIALANPANVLALVEALEKAQQQMTESENRVRKQNRHICELFDDNTALRKRIAELESRTVTVKLPRPGFITVAGERSGVYPKDEVEAALTAQGIKVEAE
ncbi:hypothetical protein KGG28_12585 [Klebsiella pneumoniae]|uniref:ead/Ea22-like family protein n=1 Tax=Klebsiella pneumoniae TaxID=573 RepID=UPI001D09B417|nr:ead/Ea22-like family protein [Klebsiella pneumoniae]MCB8438265.1 hypothetical protein [Klebsiella pneumoniae]MCB8467885.1 hypothetical protein [Klebsiella pneumoniae]